MLTLSAARLRHRLQNDHFKGEWNLMTLFGKNKFAVVFCSQEIFRGAVFAKRNSKWTVIRWGEVSSGSEFPGDRLKALLKEIGYSSDSDLFLTGELADSSCFAWESVPLPPREQQGAVEMELSGALPGNIDEPLFQFTETPSQEEGAVTVNVCAFPAASMNQVAAMLNRANYKADEFVSPFICLSAEDAPARFDLINSDYFFHKGVWKRCAGREKILEQADETWRKEMNALFVLPENFNVAKYLSVLLVARLECADKSIKERIALKVLPDQCRPLRYRTHIQLAVILLVLLIGNLLWAAYLNYGGEYREAREVASEIDSCRRKINSINSRLKRNQKASRDMARVVEITAGESDIIGKLAAFSKLLPENVLVSSLRWSDSGVDLQLQSENANINLPELLKPLNFWKIGNLQQRQMWGSDVTSINLRLVPNIENEKDKKKSGSNSRRKQYNAGARGGR